MRHCDSRSGRITAEGILELADVLQTLLRKMHVDLGNPGFSYVIHTAPMEDEDKHYYIWHVQIPRRLMLRAGCELG